MLITRPFTNAEVADRLELVARQIRQGIAIDSADGIFAEAVRRLQGYTPVLPPPSLEWDIPTDVARPCSPDCKRLLR